MFRTRDFVLLFTVIVFLLAAIGTTLVDQWWGSTDTYTASSGPAAVASTSDLVLTGTVPAATNIDRAANVRNLRNKIAQLDLEDAPDEPPTEPAPATTSEDLGPDDVIASTLVCPGAGLYRGFWDARDLQVSAREGAVVVERLLGSSSQVILQLPARTQPAATPTCLSTDVIGVATDGSLIRNDEFAFYGIFGSETLVGYALDGLPIYGVGTARGDVCGGVAVGGQHRYELSAERDTLISCFAAPPAQLP